jgi:hypothetical protein
VLQALLRIPSRRPSVYQLSLLPARSVSNIAQQRLTTSASSHALTLCETRFVLGPRTVPTEQNKSTYESVVVRQTTGPSARTARTAPRPCCCVFSRGSCVGRPDGTSHPLSFAQAQAILQPAADVISSAQPTLVPGSSFRHCPRGRVWILTCSMTDISPICWSSFVPEAAFTLAYSALSCNSGI